ncbi:MAG: PsbP-related protein [Patescibacteria group bacterium]
MKKLIVILLVLIVALLAYIAFKPKEVVSPIVVPSDQTTTTSQQNPTSLDSKTYSNTQYGFSFDYPSSWKVSEDTSKKEVTVNTNDIVGVNPENRPNPEYPSWSITFKATDKTYFTGQRISTKIGIITYDETTKALMSDDCLKATQLFGSNLTTIVYGGSTMSDPAYSNSAILTSSGEIIIVNSQQGVALTPELTSQLSKIASSFKLLNGNTIFVPACAK